MIDPRLLRYAREARNYIILIAVLGFLSGILIIAQDYLIAKALSPIVDSKVGFAAVALFLGWLTVVMTTRAMVFFIRERRAYRASAGAIRELRTHMLDHALKLGPRWNSLHGNDAVTTATRGLSDLGPYFSQYLPQLFLAMTVTPMTLIVILITDFASGMLTLLGIVLIPVFMILIGKMTEEFANRRLADMQNMGRQVLDLIVGLATLKALGRENGPGSQVQKVSADYNRSTFTTLKIAFISGSALEFVATLSVAIVAVATGARMVGGEIDLFHGLLIIMLAPEVFEPLRQVGKHFHASSDGIAAAAATFEILETPLPEIGTEPAPDLNTANIVVTDLSVKGRGNYAPYKTSFTLRPGTITALTGPSGVGKTTTAMALLGIIHADEGSIKIQTEGQSTELKQVDPELWWKQCTWIPQSPVIVPGTILENIDPTCTEKPGAELLAAAELTGFAQVITEQKAGWNTIIGAGGEGLSVGQRQRLALTRTLIEKDPLVILDEPTAHLDARLDEQVSRAILDIKKRGATVVVIAHRQTIISIADEVIELHSKLQPDETVKETAPAVALEEKDDLGPLILNLDLDGRRS